MNAEHLMGVFTLVPQNIAIRAVTLAGLLAAWVWLVAIDRLLNRHH